MSPPIWYIAILKMAWYASVRLFNQKLELRSVSNWIFSQVGIANVLALWNDYYHLYMNFPVWTHRVYIYIYTMMDFSNIRFWKFNRCRRAMRAILCRWSLPHFNRSLLGTSFQGAAALSQSEKGSVSAGACQWSPDIDKALASGPFDQQILFFTMHHVHPFGTSVHQDHHVGSLCA